jgi:hypothetical protein
MKKIIAKSAMALAIAAVSTGAFAGTTTATTKYFAQDIFGDGITANANGSTITSNETLIATPIATYTIAPTNLHTFAAGDEFTVKFTLGGSAVFGEDLSSYAKWNTSTANVNFNFGATAAGPTTHTLLDSAASVQYSFVVDSGGAIGDNTVVFKVTALAGVVAPSLFSVTLDQVKVKNLADTLGAHKITNASSKVALGAEFQILSGANAGLTDTAVAKDILASKPVLVLGGTATTVAQRPLIQVASSEKKFTGTVGNAAKSDYDSATAKTYIDLGTLKIQRAQYDTDGNGVDDAPVNKENGLAFDYQGSDTIKVKLTSATGWASYDKVYLTAVGGCNTPTPTAAFTNSFASSTGADLEFNVTTQTTAQLNTGYQVCAVAKTTAVIPETNSITATATADFFNARYMDDMATADYGVIRRNGCSVTLFNLPNVSASDDAFIRLTNVSGIAGSVRASIWKEDGTNADVDAQVAATIPAHGTLVFHTAADQASGIYLGTALPLFGAQTSGRDRIVLTGAFPACEALGLVRTPAGVLTNMTSTTYSGDAAQFGADTNGTSNTKN